MLVLLIAIFTVPIFSQSFEGKITYSNTYKSTGAVSSESWKKRMGNTTEYYIKDGDYKSVSNGTFMEWMIYVNSENKLYTKTSLSEIAYWNDVSINNDSLLDFTLNKNVFKVLDYDCDELIMTYKSGIQKFYFNTSLKVDITLFENFANWYGYLKEAKSLSLKYIVMNPSFSMESTAIKVEAMELQASDVQLKENQKTEKSPY